MIPEPTVTVTEYAVSCLPEDHDGYDSFAVLVEYWPGEGWFVRRSTRFLGGDGPWTFSDGTAKWKASHRFDLDTALRLAREATATVTVNGLTVADVLARAER